MNHYVVHHNQAPDDLSQWDISVEYGKITVVLRTGQTVGLDEFLAVTAHHYPDYVEFTGS